ncbi:MAG: 2,4'-dihydroxyacetophenone dioxygenase family protein [Acidimicrobiales bacterium]
MTITPPSPVGSSAPETVHRGVDDLPFVKLPDGTELQVVQVDLATGIWVLRTKFHPGTTLQRHRHTGQVYAFTETGHWYYLESPTEQNSSGSYLFEPAGSVHTLHVPESNTEVTLVSFAIWGANLNLDDDDNVISVTDAHSVLHSYRRLCEEQYGLVDAPVIVVGL